MRDILYLMVAILISFTFATAEPTNNGATCGETIEVDGFPVVDMGTCNADPELGVWAWLAIIMD